MDAKMEGEFKVVHSEIKRLDQKIDGVDQRLGQRIDGLGEIIYGLDLKLTEGIDNRDEKLTQRIDGVEKRIEGVDKGSTIWPSGRTSRKTPRHRGGEGPRARVQTIKKGSASAAYFLGSVFVPCASIKVISDLSSISALVRHPIRIRSLSSWSRYPRLMYLSTE
jgi:hypothetical protein